MLWFSLHSLISTIFTVEYAAPIQTALGNRVGSCYGCAS